MTVAKSRKRDQRFVRVGITMPRHEKIEPLSDKAFRLLVLGWCYCAEQQTDGKITARKWAVMGTARARTELIDAGLVDKHPTGDVEMHDYLDWQMSRAEIIAKREQHQRGAAATNHRLLHVDAGVFDPACDLCSSSEPPTEDERYSDRSSAAIAGGVAGRQRTQEGRSRSRSAGETSGGESPTATRENERPPRHCQKHPDGTTDPCGPCKDARIAHDGWRAPIASVKHCTTSVNGDEHRDYTSRVCPTCRADMLAGDRPWDAHLAGETA